MVYFYLNGRPLLSTISFCLAWAYIDYAVFLIASNLLVWAAVERHIIIFNQSWHSIQRKRMVTHYIPIVIIFIYPIIFYIYALFIEPCAPVLTYTKSRCGSSDCISRDPLIGLWNSIVNYIIPILLLVVFGLGLPVRLYFYKRRAQRQVRWKDYRKLVIQLIPILFVNLLLYFPPMLLYVAYMCGVSTDVGADFYSFCMYFSYYGVFLTPFATVFTMSELKEKCKRIVLFWHWSQRIIVRKLIRTSVRTATVAPMN